MDDITCGRPTKAGTPCRNRPISNRTTGCTAHATEIERATEAAYWEGYRDGMREGEERGRQAARWEAEHERRETAARQEAARNFREHTSDGHQNVTVERGLAYVMPRGVTVAVGDHVSVPAPFWRGCATPTGRRNGTRVELHGSLVTAHPA